MLFFTYSCLLLILHELCRTHRENLKLLRRASSATGVRSTRRAKPAGLRKALCRSFHLQPRFVSRRWQRQPTAAGPRRVNGASSPSPPRRPRHPPAFWSLCAWPVWPPRSCLFPRSSRYRRSRLAEAVAGLVRQRARRRTLTWSPWFRRAAGSAPRA